MADSDWEDVPTPTPTPAPTATPKASSEDEWEDVQIPAQSRPQQESLLEHLSNSFNEQRQYSPTFQTAVNATGGKFSPLNIAARLPTDVLAGVGAATDTAAEALDRAAPDYRIGSTLADMLNALGGEGRVFEAGAGALPRTAATEGAEAGAGMAREAVAPKTVDLGPSNHEFQTALRSGDVITAEQILRQASQPIDAETRKTLTQAVDYYKGGGKADTAVATRGAPPQEPTPEEVAQTAANDKYEAARANGNPQEIQQAYQELMATHGQEVPPIPQDERFPVAQESQPSLPLGGEPSGEPAPAVDNVAGTTPPETIPETPEARQVRRRQESQAATQELSSVPVGETKIVQPLSDEPDYYRFSYGTKDGPVSGTYYIDENGNIGGFSVGDTNNPVKIGAAAFRKIVSDIREQHPDAQSLEGYRMTGARTKGGSGQETLNIKLPKRGPVTEAAEAGTETVPSVADRMTRALNEAADKRTLQEAGYSQERSRRLAAYEEARRNGEGVEGARQALAQFKGELPKESLPNLHETFTPEDIGELYNTLRDSKLNGFEHARATTGLTKLLSGEVPQPKELETLAKVFPADFVKAVLRHRKVLSSDFKNQGEMFSGSETTSTGPIKELLPEEKPVDPDKYVYNKNQGELFPETRPQVQKPAKGPKPIAGEVPKRNGLFGEAATLSRGIQASTDLSAPLRQGLPLITSKAYWNSIVPMFRSAANEGVYNELLQSIERRPTYDLMQQSGLHLSDVGDHLSKGEENFQSNLAAHIPVFKTLYKGSERAYTGFVNKLRADTFDRYASQFQAAGLDLRDPANAGLLKATGDAINTLTGRGSLGRFESAAGALSTGLFAPRFIASRVKLLNPAYYAKLPKPVRTEAIKSMLGMGAVALTTLALAKLSGISVEADPRSSDFGQIKVGNTRYDILGGFGQYFTLGARLRSDERKTANGEVKGYGQKYGDPTRWDALTDFFTNKASPFVGVAADYLKGEDHDFQKPTVTKEVLTHVVPLYLQDVYDVMKDQGFVKGAVMGVPGLFGVGMQTYSTPSSKQGYTAALELGAAAPPPRAPDSVTVAGVGHGLSDDQKQTYLDEYTNALKAAVKDPQWKSMTDPEKRSYEREVHKAITNQMFPPANDESQWEDVQ